MTGGLLALALAALILMAAVYRRRLRRFSQILSSFQKDGTLPRQGMEDTMESKLESQLVSALSHPSPCRRSAPAGRRMRQRGCSLICLISSRRRSRILL